MAEAPKTAPPVGRTRRITGFILIALGAVLSNHVGWLGVFDGAWFGHDEWVRFTGLLWLGVVMVLMGCWLAYRARAAAWALAVAVVVLFVMAYVHDRWLR